MNGKVTHSLVHLDCGCESGILIQPSYFNYGVDISEEAWEKLKRVSEAISPNAQIVLYRGYEGFSISRFLLRRIGAVLFRIMYPRRCDEIPDIFGANGHDVDGTHIDVGFTVNGRRAVLLPLGVFTPSSIQQKRLLQYGETFQTVKAALEREGFCVHRNATEALQMHVDLVYRD